MRTAAEPRRKTRYSHHPHARRDVQRVDGDAAEQARDGARWKARHGRIRSRGGAGPPRRPLGRRCVTSESLPTPHSQGAHEKSSDSGNGLGLGCDRAASENSQDRQAWVPGSDPHTSQAVVGCVLTSQACFLSCTQASPMSGLPTPAQQGVHPLLPVKGASRVPQMWSVAHPSPLHPAGQGLPHSPPPLSTARRPGFAKNAGSLPGRSRDPARAIAGEGR